MKSIKKLKKLGALLLSSTLVLTSFIIPTIGAGVFAAGASETKIADLRVNDLIAPVGIDTPNPIFSWKMDSDKIGAEQTAYRIVVTENDGSVAWDSGWVESGDSVAIKYDGSALKAQTKYNVSVSIKDQNDEVIDAITTTFVTAFFDQSAFDDTKWISYQDSSITSLTKYTIDFDFNITSGANGFSFGMNDSISNFIMWQISVADSPDSTAVLLRPHIWANGNWKATPTSAAGQPTSAIDVTNAVGYNDTQLPGHTIHERIVVDGLTVKTYLGADANNLTCVATHNFTSDYTELLKLGKIGFRHNLQGSVERCKYDNFVIKDGNGNVVYSEDFSNGAPTFIGNIDISVDGGMLSVGTGNEGISEGRSVLSGFGTTGNANSLPSFRKEITVKSGLKSAMLYSSGLGVYEQYINGVRVGNIAADGSVTYDELKPGYTEGVKRRMYNTYDVTTMLERGSANVISAISSPSWWNADDGYLKQGDVSAYFAKLVLTYEDGSVEVVNTDSSWKTAKMSPVLMGTTIYKGEKYNANIDTSWMLPGYNDSFWIAPVINTEAQGVLTAQVGTTVTVREDLTITPIGYSVYEGIIPGSNATGFYGKVNTVATYDGSTDITLNPGQTMIVDFGQNFAGWEEFTITTAKGTVVTIDHAEMLNDQSGDQSRGNDGPEGSIYDLSYRNADAITSYTAAGKERETYHPIFTYYGFRYAEVTVSAETTFHSIKGKVVTSVHEDTAEMETSDADVNQLISNVRWSMYSNYLGIPTDCPQRSERFGWTGDTQIFAHTGLFLGNNKSFLSKFNFDLQDGQITDPNHEEYGAYPAITPGAYHLNCYGDFGWADCGIILPYYIYVMSGDTTVIEDNWDAMCLYMDEFLADKTFGGDGTFGDWLSYEGDSATSKNIIGTAYHAIDALMMADMAKAVGDTAAETRYKQTYLNKKNIFKNNFVNSNGTLKESTQSACLYALYADLVDDPDPVADQLIANIERNGCKLQTGFLGTAIIMPTLTKIGRNDIAYRLLLQHDNPSWLYSVDQGATTIWERWNSYTKADGFGDADMNSFNHYSYGAVLGWMYSDMAGIDYDTDAPGFKHFTLNPAPNTLIPTVKASYDSPYGTIVSNMEYTDYGRAWNYFATVPANTTATINVPVEDINQFTVNSKTTDDINIATDGIEFVNYENGIATFNAVAGSFDFTAAVTANYEVAISIGEKPENMPPIDAEVKVNGETVSNAIPTYLDVTGGDVITITANCLNDVDYAIKNWISSGNVLSTTNELTYTVGGDAGITVNFTDNTMKSIAEGKTVTANQVNSDWAAAHLTDGINSYLGGTNGWSSGGKEGTTFPEETAVIDLGKIMSFNRVHIYPRNDVFANNTVMNCPTSYKIYVSDNNSTWTEAYSVTNGNVTNGFAPIVIELDSAASGRYVKLGVTAVNQGDEWGNVYVQLSELGLYCTKHFFVNGICSNCGVEQTIDGDGIFKKTYNVTDAFGEEDTPFKFVVAPWSGNAVNMDTVNEGASDRDGKGLTVTEYVPASGYSNSYVSLITNSSDGTTGQLLWSPSPYTDTQIIFTAPITGNYDIDFSTNRMGPVNDVITGCRYYVKHGNTILGEKSFGTTEKADFKITVTLNKGETLIFGLDPIADNGDQEWTHYAGDTSYISKLSVTATEICEHPEDNVEWLSTNSGHSCYCYDCYTTFIADEPHNFGGDATCDDCEHTCDHTNDEKNVIVYNAADGFGTANYSNWSFSLVPWDTSSPAVPFTQYAEGTDAASVGYKTINYTNSYASDVKFSMITEAKNGYSAGTLMFNGTANHDSYITFTAPETGKYTLDTTLIRECTAEHPSVELTGSRFYVMVNGEILDEGIASTKGESVSFNIEVELQEGQTLVLAMDPIKNSVNDWAMAGADDCYITNLTMTYERESDAPADARNWTKTNTKHSATCYYCGTVVVPEEDHTFEDGKCTVCDHPELTSGDINGDSVIDLKDVTEFARHLAGWENEVNQNALDVDGNGAVNLNDLVVLAQYVAGWDVTIS